MIFNIITAFPEFYTSFLKTSLIKKSIEKEYLQFNIVDLKKFGKGKHKKIDDTPYGGGEGMLLRVDVIDKAISNIEKNNYIIALSPKGKIFEQKDAVKLSKKDSITILCGRYEGFDERVFNLADTSYSLGKYVTMGGEAPSLVMIEAISRLIPGVIGKESSSLIESHTNKIEKEYPQFTKPLEYKGEKVPKILLSGNHKKIEEWRKEKTIYKDTK